MKVKTTFLGTSTAIPTASRNHPAVLVSFINENILVDCGEGTQRQFRKVKINMCKLTRLLITHWHADHIAGIPTLLDTMAMSEYQKTLYIYGPKGTKQKFKAMEALYGKIKIKHEIKEVSGRFLDGKDFTLESAPMQHGIPANAYSITLKDKRRLDKKKILKLKIPNSPLLKKLQEGKDITLNKKKIKSSQVSYIELGKKITVILDTAFNQKAVTLAKNSDLVITESSFAENSPNGKKKAMEYKHLTAKQAATIAKKSKSKQLALIHISRRYEKSTKIIEKEAKAVFKNTIIPEDLCQIEI